MDLKFSRRVGLVRKLFIYFLSIFLIVMCVVGFFQYKREVHIRAEQLDSQLITYNNIISSYYKEKKPSWQELSDYVHMMPDVALRVTIIDSLGNLVFDSFVKQVDKIGNHLNREEVQMALTQPYGKAIRHSYTTGVDYYYVAHKFKGYFVRSALPYNVSLATMLQANTSFMYFMGALLFCAIIALYFISQNFFKSIDRLRVFTQRAEQENIINTDIDFPQDELGDISRNIVQLYKLLLQTKEQVNNEREKLIKHLQISQEGLGIFSIEKKEILVNSHFIQYTNVLAELQLESSDQIFSLPEFMEITHFIDQSILNNELNRKRLVIEKGGRIFSVQCIVFQDNTFEISINDISVQEHENELKRHLTQNISHELKTPVSSILGYMESILENPNLEPDRQRFFIERSFFQAQRLTALLQDISTLNKIDGAKRLFEKERCNIYEILTDVLNDVHLQLEQKGFTVHKHISEFTKIEGNRSLLYSIFRNLIDNSLTYAGDNITIEISCYREDKDFFYLSFIDSGIGVPEEHLHRLFERFYRVDKGRSRKMGGTGLGLAIVKNAVLYHNGSISAKNTSGGGLGFLFSLKKKS